MKKFNLGVAVIIIAGIYLCLCGCGEVSNFNPIVQSQSESSGEFFVPKTPEEIKPLPEPGPNDLVGELTANLFGGRERALAEDSFEYRLFCFLREKVEKFWIHFYIPTENGREYYGTWEWESGKTRRLKVQTYIVCAYTYSSSYGSSFGSSFSSLQLRAGLNLLRIRLRQQSTIMLPVRINNVDYPDGAGIADINGENCFSICSNWATFSETETGEKGLIFSIWFYAPYTGSEFKITLRKDGNERIFRATFDREKILTQNPIVLDTVEIPTGDLSVEWEYISIPVNEPDGGKG